MARVLIVEDELLIAEDLKHKLRRLGHTVVGQAMTGEGAVQKVREVQPEVVLMDIRLRGEMSGLEAAQRIQEVHSVTVVFVTAHASTVARTTETQPPPLVITKPFTTDQIESVIEEACRAR
jgi:CheY-like chemotaxis protein